MSDERFTSVQAATELGAGVPRVRDAIKVTTHDIGPNGGRMYTTPTGRFEVYGAILKKYLALGGPRSFLGLPTTNETGTPDGVGRFNHFRGGSIYWTPQTGAHEVHGMIRDRWAQLGWEKSYLGYPVSDEERFDQGGRVSLFQGGQLYWWPDTGAIDLRDVVVHYTGLNCFGETSWDQGSDSDEPYVICTITTPTGSRTVRSRVYDDVDAGETRPDIMEVYRGRAAGLVLGVRVMEHDHGDPEKYRKEVEAAVTHASKGLSVLVGYIPVFGPILSGAAAEGLDAARPAITNAVNKALNFGDDTIGTASIPLSPKQMVLLAARTPGSRERSVGFKVASPLVSGHGASYKVYFGVVPA
jgi:hypothetical protein